MKPITLLVVFFLILCSCVSNSNQKTIVYQEKNRIIATYTPYITAMGKGKGIIFRVKISNINFDNFSIDSFIINNKSLPFTQNRNDSFVAIESNYLKSKKEPSFSDDSKLEITEEIEDPIILNQKFYPSWIIITNNIEKIKLIIENYKNTQ
jgi:uncharacterized membrane protein YcgQ (UPF0703/DUF1980 family)